MSTNSKPRRAKRLWIKSQGMLEVLFMTWGHSAATPLASSPPFKHILHWLQWDHPWSRPIHPFQKCPPPPCLQWDHLPKSSAYTLPGESTGWQAWQYNPVSPRSLVLYCPLVLALWNALNWNCMLLLVGQYFRGGSVCLCCFYTVAVGCVTRRGPCNENLCLFIWKRQRVLALLRKL